MPKHTQAPLWVCAKNVCRISTANFRGAAEVKLCKNYDCAGIMCLFWLSSAKRDRAYPESPVLSLCHLPTLINVCWLNYLFVFSHCAGRQTKWFLFWFGFGLGFSLDFGFLGQGQFQSLSDFKLCKLYRSTHIPMLDARLLLLNICVTFFI